MSHWFSGLTETEAPRTAMPDWMMDSLWSNVSVRSEERTQGYAHDNNMFTPVIGNFFFQINKRKKFGSLSN